MPVRIQSRPCAISHSSLKAKLWTSSQTVPDGSSIKGRGGFVGVYTHNGPVCTGSYFTLMRCGIVLLSERQGSEKRLDSRMMSQINWHVLARPTQKYDMLVWHTLSHSHAQVLIKHQNALLQTKAYNLVSYNPAYVLPAKTMHLNLLYEVKYLFSSIICCLKTTDNTAYSGSALFF